MVVAGARRKIFGHRVNFARCLDRRRHAAQVGQIGGIHADYEVEIIEVFNLDLTATVGKLQTSTARMDAHPPVGELTDVVASGAGRIYNEAVGGVIFVNDLAKHAFGGRAAANVAQTDEQHSFFCIVFHAAKLRKICETSKRRLSVRPSA